MEPHGKHPIILEGWFDEHQQAYFLSVTVETKVFMQTFSIPDFVRLCMNAANGITCGGLSFIYRHYDKRDVGPRTRRSITQYVRSLSRHC